MKKELFKKLVVMAMVGSLYLSSSVMVMASDAETETVEEAGDESVAVEDESGEAESESVEEAGGVASSEADAVEPEEEGESAEAEEADETIESEEADESAESEEADALNEDESEEDDEAVEVAERSYAEEVPDRALAAAETDITRLNIDEMQKVVTGKGVNVAVMGLDFPYDAELARKVKGVYDANTDSSDLSSFWDSAGADTHDVNCAKILLSVAPNVNLYLIKNSYYAYVSNYELNALKYADRMNCRVISYSFWWYHSPYAIGTSVIQEINSMYSKSSGSGLIFSSGGNTGKDELHYPSGYDNVIAVSASTYNKSQKKYVPNAANTYNDQIELSSPGGSTSAATPFAAGAAALLFEAKPNMTAAECRNLLRSTALDIGNAGKDRYSGYGLIQPVVAFKRILPYFHIAVGKPKISSISADKTGVKINWGKISGINGYTVYRGGKKVTNVSGTTYTDKNAKNNGTKYTYTIKAYKTVVGTAYYSAASAAKSVCFLSVPSLKSAVAIGGRKARVKWATNTKAAGYKLQYSTSSAFKKASTITIKNAKTSSRDIAKLTRNKTYYFRVCAYKGSDNSPWSGVRRVKIR